MNKRNNTPKTLFSNFTMNNYAKLSASICVSPMRLQICMERSCSSQRTDTTFIYSHAHRKAVKGNLVYYRMTQEYIEQVIKDQPEIWHVIEIEENSMEDKEKKAEKEQEKEQAKAKDKGKAIAGEKRQGTTELGSPPRKKL